jgi:hypothetical protein
MKPTIARLRALLEYNQATGLFRWRMPSVRQAKGWFRGNKSVRKYRRLYIDGHHYLAHIVARALVSGAWPTSETDHRDRKQSNNRWRNLRAATRSQNGKNRSVGCNNTTGIRGVTRYGERFRARICVDGKMLSLGLYDMIEAAGAVRREAEKLHYGDWS